MRLKDVNTTDIRDAIVLGCRTMQNVFNADDNDIPFFRSSVWPEAYLRFHKAHSESHVPGRHLNALLRAREVCGVELDEAALDKHARAAYFSFSSPLPLPLNRAQVGTQPDFFLAHNLREGLHALYALLKYRGDERALDLIKRCIQTIWQHWNPKDRWDAEALTRAGLRYHPAGFITSEARAIGPLVKIFIASGYAPALDLAIALKQRCVNEHFMADGSYDVERMGTHTHSVTCTMSSLAQLAVLTSDQPLLDRVRAFYDHGLNDIRDGVGWVLETHLPTSKPDRGEMNNTGDIIETALILGAMGHTQYFHDAERMIRCHVLPGQLRDVSFITDPPNPENIDGLRNVADRHRGAFGFPAPYGHHHLDNGAISFNMDIVGGTVASLCEAYEAMTNYAPDRAGHRVNMLFDHRTEAIAVESPYTHDALRITVRKPAPLWVCLPSWVDRNALRIDASWREAGDWLMLAEPPVGRPLTIGFELVESSLVLRHRTRDIRVRLRGDSVLAMDNFGADFTFFPPL